MPKLQDVAMTLEYPYTRTTGPVMGAFLTGLRDGKILGNKCGDRVLCPPLEFDPDTAEPIDAGQFVEIGPGGTVKSWTWVAQPTRKHPFDRPFAFALIQLDGADTPFVHAIEADGPDEIRTGMRVAVQFRDERHGAITDVYFVPEGKAKAQTITPGEEPVTITEHLVSLEINEPLYAHRRRFAQGLLDGRVLGQRSPVSGKVYVPSLGYDNIERTEMTEADDVEVADIGSISSYTIITPVQYYGQKETEPYIRASILLDGADSPIIGVDVRDIPIDEFRVGMRVKAQWLPEAERDVSELGNRFGGAWEGVIARWEPTGEPDVDPRPLQEFAF